MRLSLLFDPLLTHISLVLGFGKIHLSTYKTEGKGLTFTVFHLVVRDRVLGR